MATVRLSDIIDVTVFQDMPAVNDPEKTAFFQSGVIARSPLFNSLCAAAGATAELPFWNDLDPNDEPNISSDDPNSLADTSKIAQGKQTARKANLNKGWSASDLASDMAMGANAMDQIRARTDTYWNRQMQRRVLATCVGIMLDNVANHDSDMVHDVSVEDNSAVTDDNLFSRTAVVAAAFTLGDAFENTGVISMHSHIYKRMVDNNDIEFIEDSQGNMTIPTYMGKRVVYDDTMPVIAGTTSGFRYVTMLYGAGALGYGEDAPLVPVEVERAPAGGDGGGIEKLWTRKKWIVHPFGYQFTSASVSADSATLAELKDPANWTRVLPRKNVPIAYLITN